MRQFLKQFLQLESAAGVILFLAATAAMVWVNSPYAYLHDQFIQRFLFLINDGLMAIFFLIVGLELKRGFLEGQLSSPKQIILPAIAALGGMLIPAFIYAVTNSDNPETIKGWAIPVATDIAFALAVLSLFSRRVPEGLKLFLLALAIFDDIGAILIIAVFYSHGLSLYFLLLAGLIIALIYLMNRYAVNSVSLYLIVGCLLWFLFLQAGIHPTLSGVILGLMIPDTRKNKNAPLHKLEQALHPWVAYLIMPLFAIANAGFKLQGASINPLASQITLGIVLGLVLGKQMGVFGFAWLAVKSKFAKLPENVGWASLYGVALLCGIGFTMSLFLGTLSFQRHELYLADVRYGVMLGSVLSGLCGAIVLFFALDRKTKKR